MRSASAVVLFVLAGCVAMPNRPTPVAMPQHFDATAHASFAQAGAMRIAGQAFLRQRGGGVVTCAGSTVMLWPDTEYFRVFARAARSGSAPPYEAREQLRAVVRTTKCDALGRFEFAELPAAQWLVLTTVSWSAGGYAQGGALMSEAKSGQTAILMSDSERVE